MPWTNADHKAAEQAAKAGVATKRQIEKLAEATRSGDPNRGRNADARNALRGK